MLLQRGGSKVFVQGDGGNTPSVFLLFPFGVYMHLFKLLVDRRGNEVC